MAEENAVTLQSTDGNSQTTDVELGTVTPEPSSRLDDDRDRRRFEATAQALASELVAEAEMAVNQQEAALLWCCAGELHEFGTGNRELAFRCYGKAASRKGAAPAAFAGLRRLARAAGHHEQLGELYRIECDAATDATQRLRATAQRAIWMMGQGQTQELAQFEKTLRDVDCADTDVSMLAYTVRQDLALCSNRYGLAAEVQVARMALAESMVPETDNDDHRELAEMAAAVAMTHRYLTGDRKAAASWLERSFKWLPTETALHALGSLGWLERFPVEYQRFVGQLLETEIPDYSKARECFDLGMLQAYKLGNRADAVETLETGMNVPEVGSANASEYLAMTRAEPAGTSPDKLVDALGMRAELAATARERSDCLFQMALIFDSEMGLPDAAIELLRESLEVCPDYSPAARALSRLYQRRGAWGLLAELLEAEVASDNEAWRTRMSLAEVYHDRLLAPERAEPHLRLVLADGYYQPAAHRLAEILTKQERWAEVHELLLVAAQSETDIRERLYHLERAADVAENKLCKLEVAVACWQTVHEIDPLHPGCLAALSRLLRQLGHWEKLVALNRDEIAVRDEPEAAARLWTECGIIYSQHLNDEANAQQAFELALVVLPTYEPALEGLGRILWNHADWDGLIDMYQAEIAVLPEGVRRKRRQLDLGVLQALQAGRPEAALSTFQAVFREDPQCEEALLWMERLHETLRDDARTIAVMERRLPLADPDKRPMLALRIAALSEWALGKPKRAWPCYVEALSSPICRPYASSGLNRLWPAVVEDEDAVAAALDALEGAIAEELRVPLKAELTTLQRILQRGSRTLSDWAGLRDDCSDDVVARAATEVSAATEGSLDVLVSLRGARKAGALWALATTADAGSDALPAPELLPGCSVTTDLLAELDQLADDNSYLAQHPSVEFRRLVRAWANGDSVPTPSGDHPSIPALRLSSQAALEAGDPVQASQLTEREALSWSSAATAQRRLAVAAELRHGSDQEAAQRLFSKALDIGCFGDDSRNELYARLERTGELDLLVEGLTAHVTHCEAPEARLPWLRRLAAVSEQARNPNAALAAWQSILAIDPTDSIALLEQTRLFTTEGLLDEARSNLERALRRQFPKDERIALLSRLADLQLMDDGDGTKAVAALEEAADLADRSNDWLRRLARAHFAYGKADRAVNLLVEALPSTVEEVDLPDWFLLAKLKYLRMDDPDGARELLWGLLEKYPGNLDVLGELERFYRKSGGASDLAERLSTLLVDPPEALTNEVKAFLWEYVGDLNYQVLRRNRDAEVAFDASLSAGGAPPRLGLKIARSVAQQPGKGREACERFATALRYPDIGLAEWREVVSDLEALFEGIEDQARVRVIRQIDALLNDASLEDRGARIKRDPGREVELPVAISKLCAGLLEEGSLDVLEALRPVLERCFKDRRPTRRAIGARRFKSSDVPDLSELLDLGAETIHASVPKIYTSADRNHPEWVGNGFLLPRHLLDTDDPLAIRFWAGHTIGSTAPQLSALALAQPGEVESILAEILRLNAGGSPAGSGFLKEVASSRVASVRERVGVLLETYPRLIDRVSTEDWPSLPIYIADRFGLLLTGDVRVAISAIVGLDADIRAMDRAERAVTEPRSKILLEYALSTQYQELRYLVGLGARPRIL